MDNIKASNKIFSIEDAKKLDILVSFTPDILSDDVADMALALYLGVSRKLKNGYDWIKSGNWALHGEMPLNKKISGSKCGILGLGRIGFEIAKRLEAFKTEIHYFSRKQKKFSSKLIYYNDPLKLCKNVENLFVALKGEKYDGLDYVESAINSGSVAIVAETENPNPDHAVPWVKVPNCREAMSAISDIFNNGPSEELRVIGVTGTNGKTTTSYMIQSLLDLGHRRSGLIGTIDYDLKSDDEIEVTHTTPEAIDLQNYLSQMLSNGCCSAVMEVSSHALTQRRTSHVHYDVAVFTNLSHDHLDYHGDMDRYFNAKKILFDQLSNNEVKNKAVAVINYDDDWG